LFGLTLLSHQIGGFRRLSGRADNQPFRRLRLDVVRRHGLAVMAAVINLPIREAPIEAKLAIA
jgi:hypothetical protein